MLETEQTVPWVVSTTPSLLGAVLEYVHVNDERPYFTHLLDEQSWGETSQASSC